MARNMIAANTAFFNNIISALKNDDLIAQVMPAKRYLNTDETEKDWLKNLVLKEHFHFSRDSYALLSILHDTYYLCLINVETPDIELGDPFLETSVNSGLVTVLGAEGYLTSNISNESRLEIFNNVLYDTSQTDYSGHQWSDIERYFPNINCYKINFSDPDVEVGESSNAFYWLLCRVALQFEICNNNYGEIASDAWEKVIYEYDFTKIQYKNLLLSYTALTWDISYLYLYQCLEDKFACEAVHSLHKKLGVELSEQELSYALYDELSWQPKDLESLRCIIEKCMPTSTGIKLLKTLSGNTELEKWIYSMRNRIVHETRDALIPLDQDKQWETAIAGLSYILKEI